MRNKKYMSRVLALILCVAMSATACGKEADVASIFDEETPLAHSVELSVEENDNTKAAETKTKEVASEEEKQTESDGVSANVSQRKATNSKKSVSNVSQGNKAPSANMENAKPANENAGRGNNAGNGNTNPGSSNAGSINSGNPNAGSINSGNGNKKPVTPAEPITPQEPEEERFELDAEYSLVWEDEFEGTQLDVANWNYEVHEPGWVNSELQAYVVSDENVYVQDGNLIIQPIKSVDESGNVTYTSGRVNTQNKQDFKYGYFECRAKVPTGAGYLPAFWMMPQNENLYGQWPKCGEIDIMEVMGQQTNKLYGTIHYGEPHAESQGTKTHTSGNFADEYHTFACEWEPGCIKWYVDGILYHEENDWYSATKNVGTIAYPAPFDQPFYMILNVAVGGSWVGGIDETTKFDETSQLVVDYVRVYQKDSYDENVTKPVKDVVLRDPDEAGNYVINGTFESESLTDDTNWKFMTALGGVADATIADHTMTIATTDEGTVDYSVQLVQAQLPFKKGGIYKVSFDAKASAERAMNTAIKAPDRSYMAYMSENTELTNEWKTYEYTFTMLEDDDANGRLEYNMGAAGSVADIFIKNVSVVKVDELPAEELEKKTILANGNLVYNGQFQEGEGRLGFWNVSNKEAVSVTNENNERQLCVAATEEPVVISQKDLAFTNGVNYELTFVARGLSMARAAAVGTIKVNVAGVEKEFEVTTDTQNYSVKISAAEYANCDLTLTVTGNGNIYIDNVSIVEDSLIKNGSFNAGLSGFELYTYSGDLATVVVDSLNEDNAADITVKKTGSNDWYIQLKQNNISLEQGQWYNLSFKVKSNLARKIMYAIQRDGSADDDWTPYSGSQIIALAGDGEYETISYDFKMANASDEKAILSITLGAVAGEQIDTQHRICIDDIVLSKIDAPEIKPTTPTGSNMVSGLNMYGNAAGCVNGVSEDNGTYTYQIATSGSNEWDVQLFQNNLSLATGKTYRISFAITSSINRLVKVAFRDANQGYQGHYDVLNLSAGNERTYTVDYTWGLNTTDTADFSIFMGMIENEAGDVNDEHEIVIKKIEVTEIQ